MQSYKSLPHQIRRVFERRNAQKPEFRSKTGVLRRSAFREAKLESPDATLPSHPGQGVTDAEELCSVTDFMACCSEKKRVRLVEENIPV